LVWNFECWFEWSLIFLRPKVAGRLSLGMIKHDILELWGTWWIVFF